MIPLLCAGVLFVILWRKRRMLFFTLLPGIVFNLPATVALLTGFIQVYLHVCLFIVGIVFKICKFLFHFILHLVPVVFHTSRPVVNRVGQMSYNSVAEARWSFLALWNTLREKLDMLFIAIGTLAAGISLFVNFLGNVVNTGAARHRRNVRHQNRNQRGRIYPDLTDEYGNNGNDNYAFENMRNRNHEDSMQNSQESNEVPREGGLEPTAPAAGLEPTAPVMDENACVVCFERQRNAAIFPCGHTHLCLQCTRNIIRLNNTCPICQQQIKEYRQVFV